MEVLFNHNTICSFIYLGNIQGALNLFEERFQSIQNQSGFFQCKIFVLSLNFALYNYLLNKKNLSLHQSCLTYYQKISQTFNLASLNKVGIEIIHHYISTQDYSIECFSHPEINKAVQYIYTHIQDTITLESVCAAINLNKCYFCTLFKMHTGQTFTQFLNEARIHIAKKLLIEAQLTLPEIAFQCGFNNYSYFCTTFKKIIGISPSEFSLHHS